MPLFLYSSFSNATEMPIRGDDLGSVAVDPSSPVLSWPHHRMNGEPVYPASDDHLDYASYPTKEYHMAS